MNKLLIATLAATLSATMLVTATDALAQSAASTAAPAAKAAPKHPAPKHRLIKRKSTKTEAKVETAPEGSVKWACEDGLSFELKGDMKRDQIVTVHWANKNYNLPRESTTTGADRFHDAASGLDLVVIPTKAMLLSDNDGSRLADECKAADMAQGEPAATQSSALKTSN